MKKFDLEERTLKFSAEIVLFCRKIKETTISRPIIIQLVRSGTSVGANYSEANDAFSKKDFLHKLTLVRKEIKETKYWLRICLNLIEEEDEINLLLSEASELNLIFSSIINKLKKPSEN